MLVTRALVTFKCQMTEAEAKKSSFPAKQKERGRLRQRGWHWGHGAGTGDTHCGQGRARGTAWLRCPDGKGAAGALVIVMSEHGSGQGTERGTERGSEPVTSTPCPQEGELLRVPRLAFEMEMSLPALPP